MKAPNSSKEITKPWLEYMLAIHLNKQPIKVVNFTVAPGSEPGDGFNSELVKITAEVAEGGDGQIPDPQNTTTFNMIAKFLSVDPFNREANRKMKSNEREYFIYKELMGKLNTFLISTCPEESKISLPKLIYGKLSAKEYILVLENIKIQGYDTNDKRKGLDLQHLLLAVESIAKVHALSFVYNKIHDIRKEYPSIQESSKFIHLLKPTFMGMFTAMIDILKSSKETETVGNKFEAAKMGVFQNFVDSLTDESHINCLIHGDFWNSNMMFKYKDSDTKDEIENIMLIDWGNCSFGNPFYDLQYIIHTSTTKEVRQAHLEEVLHKYHSTFTRIVTLLDAPSKNWDYGDFKAKWDESRPAGFLLGLALLGTLSVAMSELMKKESSTSDKSYMLPIKAVVNGMKSGLAKMMVPLAFTSVGQSVMEGMMKKYMKPIIKEIKSGENVVLNKRFFDLVYEADEEGLFNI